ncbi:MCP four helix bundle domain-containing protein [Gemmata sp. G18]|uniref:MCP four helix bundle domain-containing protein n=1 Tax=Gemmata palustris TaxID=2822762 RepID=A0ABS5C4V4_9BACT|nr:methyl-accepting chemotaxis protein [Gemmata palustris]MBP3961046.1 MCP four helix bundle domain-containing protein [Gemmata palustris]
MNWFRNQTVMTKLLLGFALVCAIVAGSGVLGYRGLSNSRESMRVLYEDYTVAGTDLAKASVNLARFRNSMIMAANAKDAQTVDRIVDSQKTIREQVTTGLDAYAATDLRVSRGGRDERKDLDKVRAAVKDYFDAAARSMQAIQDLQRAPEGPDRDATRKNVTELMTQAGPKFDAATVTIDELVKTVTAVAKDVNEDGSATASAAQQTLVGGTLATVVLSMLIGVTIGHSITRPLGRTVAVLEGVTKGDLSQRADADSQDEIGRMGAALNVAIGSLVAAKEAERVQVENDRQRAAREAAVERERTEREAAATRAQAELERAQAAELQEKMETVVTTVSAMAAGDFTQQVPDMGTDAIGHMASALNKAIVSVRTALEGVREVSVQLADASSQLSAASDEISTGAQEQASSLEETASTLEEITATVKQNSDSAQQARQLASSSKEVAEKGGAVVGNAVDAMGEINHSSKKIADIITTIDEIAFQTNLLALNAAVEAARAGEQGRGFAVVASEVRNLAQRSATAAKEIKSLIEDSVKKVDAGTDLVNRSGATLGEIVTSVKRVTDIITEIAAASKEQSTGIDQVNKAVSQMDTVTQRNASQTEEMSATAQTLTDQADQLRDLVARFKLSDDGRVAPRPAHKAARSKAPATKPRPAVAKALKNGHSKTHELDRLGGNDGFTEF